MIEIDQAPIGRTPRSNPATYTGVFAPIRELYAMLPEARERGYKPGRFSFNVKGGRCEACQGDGLKRIEMNFLPDVYVPCDVCRGRRYNSETLQVRFDGVSIADLLESTAEDALDLLRNFPAIRQKLQTLVVAGLGYLHLGASRSLADAFVTRPTPWSVSSTQARTSPRKARSATMAFHVSPVQ